MKHEVHATGLPPYFPPGRASVGRAYATIRVLGQHDRPWPPRKHTHSTNPELVGREERWGSNMQQHQSRGILLPRARSTNAVYGTAGVSSQWDSTGSQARKDLDMIGYGCPRVASALRICRGCYTRLLGASSPRVHLIYISAGTHHKSRGGDYSANRRKVI